MRDFYHIVSDYDGVAVDSHESGVISVYRVPNGSNYDVCCKKKHCKAGKRCK